VSHEGDGKPVVLVADNEQDIIALGVHMPKLDGYQVTKEIRQDESLRATPVIILSASVKGEDVAASFKAGADDNLKKPFSPASLAARVGALLESR
jgi:DNA-binding response OmpR family regulator